MPLCLSICVNGVIACDQAQADRYYQLAQKAETNNNLIRAQRHTQKAIDVCNEDYKSWLLLGKIERDLGQAKSAQYAYQQAISYAHTDEERSLSVAGYGEIAFLLQQSVEAVYALDRAIALSPSPPTWMTAMAAQFQLHLDNHVDVRGFHRLGSNNDERDRYQSQFIASMKQLVATVGGDIHDAFTILAQSHERQYGDAYFEAYNQYLQDVLIIKEALISSDNWLFEERDLVKVINNLTLHFQRQNESLSETVSRIQQVNKSLNRIGFSDISIESSRFNQAIADAAGGVEALNTMIDRYQKDHQSLTLLGANLRKQQEALTRAKETVTAQFLSLSLDLNDFGTFEQFSEYFDHTKSSLSPERFIAMLQAGQALKLLRAQESNILATAEQRVELLDLIAQAAQQLANETDRAHQELASLRRYTSQQRQKHPNPKATQNQYATLETLSKTYNMLGDTLQQIK